MFINVIPYRITSEYLCEKLLKKKLEKNALIKNFSPECSPGYFYKLV